LFPRVAAAGEVDEDDSERPNIVVRSRVRTEPLEETSLAFCRITRNESERKSRRRGKTRERTGRHVESRTATKITTRFFSSCETEIRQHNLLSIVEAEDVLGLEIPVEDSLRMAVFDRIDDLKENSSNEFVVAEIPLSLRDHSKQISFLTEL
jgi:hypothetical protein